MKQKKLLTLIGRPGIEIIEKYNLCHASPYNNRQILSFYNNDGNLRFSDHWGGQICSQKIYDHDKKFMVLARKSKNGKYYFILSTPRYRWTKPPSNYEKERYLKLYNKKISDKVSEILIKIHEEVKNNRLFIPDNLKGQLGNSIGKIRNGYNMSTSIDLVNELSQYSEIFMKIEHHKIY